MVWHPDDPKTNEWNLRGPPNYPDDLNAMHAAEERLTEAQRHRYTAEVAGVIGDTAKRFDICHATAAQRAEAFLRILSLWTP